MPTFLAVNSADFRPNFPFSAVFLSSLFLPLFRLSFSALQEVSLHAPCSLVRLRFNAPKVPSSKALFFFVRP
jgi:hypothetical protein